jgi:hypothetical protein
MEAVEMSCLQPSGNLDETSHRSFIKVAHIYKARFDAPARRDCVQW